MKLFFYFTTMTLIFVLCSTSSAKNNRLNNILIAQYESQDTVASDSFESEEDFNNPELDSIPEGIKEKCNDFFNSLMKETVSEAYNNLFRGSPISRNQDKIRNLIVSTSKAIEIYGKIYGFESAGIKKISPSYSKVKYFSLHSLNPIEWTITFYKSPTIGWIVLNFKFSDTF